MSAVEAQRCNFMGGDHCKNKIAHESGLCAVHRYSRRIQTPMGQVGEKFGLGDPNDFLTKLQREREEPIPADSAGIPGFPYLRKADLQSWYQYRVTGNPSCRPQNEDILDRYPTVIPLVDGSDLNGFEVAVYDSEGTLHVLSLRVGPQRGGLVVDR
jgi:hypothetical protein